VSSRWSSVTNVRLPLSSLISLLALVGALAATTAGAAPNRPATNSRTIASYCSPSGDVCFGVFSRRHKIYLRISTAAHYFGRYNLCVRLLPPSSGAAHALRCGSFPVFRQGGSTWGSTVNYARQYPVKVSGRYRVTWGQGGTRLGPPLYFRLPQ
jgi:hypothetical protein